MGSKLLQKARPLEEYLRELALAHSSDPEFRTEFACYFQERAGGLGLLEVSPTVLDPGDEEFYGVEFDVPPTDPPVRQVRIILVTPEEFERARKRPRSRGGRMLERLRRDQNYHILVGEDGHYARELRRAAQ